MIYSLVFLLVIHYLADFLCQTREMATNKSTSLKWLTYHVLTYTMVLAFSMSAFMYFTSDNAGDTIMTVWLFTIINGVLHWGTDFLTSKGTTHFYKQENWFGFFSLIGLDQLIHTVTLLLTFNYFLN
jgi:hypothetical protein